MPTGCHRSRAARSGAQMSNSLSLWRSGLTGISGRESDPLPVSLARRRELTLHWCRRFLNNYPATLALVASGRLDVASLITHSFPLERAQDAFRLVTDNADGVLKASVDF